MRLFNFGIISNILLMTIFQSLIPIIFISCEHQKIFLMWYTNCDNGTCIGVVRIEKMKRSTDFIKYFTELFNCLLHTNKQTKITSYSSVSMRASMDVIAGLSLGSRPPNERRRYIVTTSLISWVQT